MGNEPDDDIEITDEEQKVFGKLLKTEAGKNWLTETLKELGLTAPQTPQPPSKAPESPLPGAGGLETFLQNLLGEEKAKRQSLEDRLEAVLDLLTPEQRLEMKASLKPKEGEVVPPKTKQPKPPAPPVVPQPPLNTVRKLIKRL